MAYKHSKQRDQILDYMKSLSDKHVSAEDIHQHFNRGDKTISLATIYRNLGILEDMKEIKKISLPNESSIYDKTCEPHYHFYCEKCKKLYDLDVPYKPGLHDEVSDDSVIGVIDSHEITFKGVCKHCTSNGR